MITFTFHFDSIKTEDVYGKHADNINLHFTLILLKLDMSIHLNSGGGTFTFHFDSIKTKNK